MSLLELFKTFTRGQENAQDQLNANFAALEGAVIVDSGINSNGSWTKFADGTMIVYRKDDELDITDVTSGSVSTVALNNPMKFLNQPSVSINGFFTNANGDPLFASVMQALSGGGVGDSYFSFILENNTGKTITRVLNFNAIAIGRWK